MQNQSNPPVRYCASQCGNNAANGRRVCNSCRNKRYRSNNVIPVLYDRLRGHANARGIPFLLSFKYFRKWVIETDYINLRGRKAGDMTVDRIVPRLGYSDGNIQMLTNEANAKKRWTDMRMDFKTKEQWGTPF